MEVLCKKCIPFLNGIFWWNLLNSTWKSERQNDIVSFSKCIWTLLYRQGTKFTGGWNRWMAVKNNPINCPNVWVVAMRVEHEFCLPQESEVEEVFQFRFRFRFRILYLCLGRKLFNLNSNYDFLIFILVENNKDQLQTININRIINIIYVL